MTPEEKRKRREAERQAIAEVLRSGPKTGAEITALTGMLSGRAYAILWQMEQLGIIKRKQVYVSVYRTVGRYELK
jgi:DNA-binding MarR family transcriptional regulator